MRVMWDFASVHLFETKETERVTERYRPNSREVAAFKKDYKTVKAGYVLMYPDGLLATDIDRSIVFVEKWTEAEKAIIKIYKHTKAVTALLYADKKFSK